MMTRLKLYRSLVVLALLLELSAAINDEGRALLLFRERVEVDPYGALGDWDAGAPDPCLWFGVECFDRKVVSLILKDLCLQGMLAPELGKLIHLKSLILPNNSFSGVVPKEIGELQKLEVLDLQYNNLSGPLPSEIGNILSLESIALRGNIFMGSIPPELDDLNIYATPQIHEGILTSEQESRTRHVRNVDMRRLLQVGGEDRVWHRSNGNNNVKPQVLATPSPVLSGVGVAPALSPSYSPFHSPEVSPSPMASTRSLSPSPNIGISAPVPAPSPTIEPPHPVMKPKYTEQPSMSVFPPPSYNNLPSVPAETQEKVKSWKIYVPIVAAVSFLLLLSGLYLLCCRANRVVTVKPWATGLSGQLQKAFVTGVPALKRSELDVACEDFSNIIGSLSDCKLYKGTLSSGVEIAVVSTVITSAKDWSKQSESQFRKKISILSKVNHKNFVNLLGYCEEQEPFTRMMVFEYAPNGTLFEHLHVKVCAEVLDWAARLRIAMGVAYCLDHMHQLNPPVILKDLNSSAIYLTDDYAAKVGDIRFWYGAKEAQSQPLETLLPSTESIVYKFGMLMLEILAGSRVPFSEDALPESWLSCFLNGAVSVKDLIDPTIGSYREEDVSALLRVIRSCMNPDPTERPTMAEVAAKLKDITSMTPDRATPRVSPLWWAEIEVLSAS